MGSINYDFNLDKKVYTVGEKIKVTATAKLKEPANTARFVMLNVSSYNGQPYAQIFGGDYGLKLNSGQSSTVSKLFNTPTEPGDHVMGFLGGCFMCNTASSSSTSYKQIDPLYLSYTVLPKKIDGICGSSDTATSGATFTSAPTSNFCTSGTPSLISSDPGPWTWSCIGSGGGSTAPCKAEMPACTPTTYNAYVSYSCASDETRNIDKCESTSTYAATLSNGGANYDIPIYRHSGAKYDCSALLMNGSFNVPLYGYLPVYGYARNPSDGYYDKGIYQNSKIIWNVLTEEYFINNPAHILGGVSIYKFANSVPLYSFKNSSCEGSPCGDEWALVPIVCGPVGWNYSQSVIYGYIAKNKSQYSCNSGDTPSADKKTCTKTTTKPAIPTYSCKTGDTPSADKKTCTTNCAGQMALTPKNGACNPDFKGQVLSAAPTVGSLCLAGSESLLTGDGTKSSPWTWSCSASNGGITDDLNCTATNCGSSYISFSIPYTCKSGESGIYADSYGCLDACSNSALKTKCTDPGTTTECKSNSSIIGSWREVAP